MSDVRRREALVAALVAAVAFLPFLRGTLSGASLYFRDLALYFLPLRRLALEGLRSGEVRFWNPYLHEGVPLSLPAVGYPPDLLQLVRPDEVGISLVLALHVPLAALGAYVLARRLLDLPPVASAGGALVYALGGFLLSTVNLYVHLQAAAWAPFVVLTLARVAGGAGRRAVAGAALVLALAVSTTGIEIVAQAVVIGLMLGLRPRAGRLARGMVGTATTLGLAALAAAPVLVLVASQVGDSARGQGFPTDVALAHSVHPFTLLQALVGGLLGNPSNLAGEWWGQNFFPRGFPYLLSLYLGATALAVAVVGAVGRHPMRTRLVILVGAGLVLCLGRWAGLAVLVDPFPAVRVLRYPVKAFFAVHLGVALLVALGLTRLASAEGRRWWWGLTFAAAALGALLVLVPVLPHVVPGTMASFGAAFFPSGLGPEMRSAYLARILADAATGGAVALALAAVAGLAGGGRLPPRRAALLAVALVAADLLRVGSGLNPMVTGSFFRPSPELASELDALRAGRTFTCRFDASRGYHEARGTKGTTHEAWTFAVALETLTPAFNVPMRVPTAMSPDLTMLVPEDRVLRPSDAGCANPGDLLPRLRRAGVRAVLSADPLVHPALRLRRVLRPPRIAPLGVHVYELGSPLPRAYVASNVVPVADASEGAVEAAGRGFLEADGAAVEGGRAIGHAGGRIEEIEETTDRIRLVAEADSPTVLVVREGWAPGWTARVNGRPTPVRRANGRHLSVALPRGHSEVVLRYRPPGLGPSLAISALALAALGALSRAGRRPASPGDRAR